jgi:phosphoglycolate phosphatase-like HAD superfamily hydrolase
MTFTPPPRAALVIAFDGVLADTLPLRHEALASAAAQHGVARTEDELWPAIAGRTMAESVDALRANRPVAWAMDETTRDLLVLTAQRAYHRRLAHGVTFRPSVVARLRQAALSGERVILRADSARSDVAPLLAVLGIEPLVTWLRASDDPSAPSMTAGIPSVEHSWRAIGARLDRWHCDPTRVDVQESCAVAAAAAAPFAHRIRTIDEAW